MGRETVPAVPPKLIALAIRLMPTNIGSPSNVGVTVRTTQRDTWNLKRDTPSPERLERELQLGSTERRFQHLLLRLSDGFRQSTFLCHYL